MTVELTDDDRGKTLVSRNKRLGVLTDVRGDTAFFDLDWDNVPEGLAAELDWDPDDDTHRANASIIEATRNDEVVIRDDLWPR